jgi:Sigma-70, region 4
MSRRPRQPVLLALAKLDERKSRLVELRYFSGLTSDEAAEVLGMPPHRRSRMGDRAWPGFSRAVELKKAGLLPAGSSGRAVKHFAEMNSRNRLRVSDYLASTLAHEKLRASACVANCCARRRVANEIWM